MASVESSPWLRLRRSLQEPGTRLAVIVVLLAGLGAGLIGAIAWNRRQLDRLVIHVGELAVGFEPHDFTGLAPAPADRESPVYTKLKARLQAMNELNPEDAFI
jgi:hypothetical protein